MNMCDCQSISRHIASIIQLNQLFYMYTFNDILKNIDNEVVTLLVMLDMSFAFESIDHNILIDILRNDFGLVDNGLQWLRLYLANRRQRVVIDRCKSSEFMVAIRVLQGSCLGPVLLLLYVSGLLRDYF